MRTCYTSYRKCHGERSPGGVIGGVAEPGAGMHFDAYSQSSFGIGHK